MSDLCNHDLLERCVEGTCTPDETARMEAHLLECRSCADERTWLRRERALLRDHAASDARSTDALWAGVEAELLPARARAPRRSNLGWLGGVAAAAAAVLVLVLVKMAPLHTPLTVKPAVPSQGAALSTQHLATGDQTLIRDWSFHVTPLARIEIENTAGSVRVQTHTGHDVVVNATFESMLPGWHVEATQEGDRIVVRSACGQKACGVGLEVDLTVLVPMGVPIPATIKTISASVEVKDFAGGLTIDTISGDVRVEGSRVRSVHSFSGDVDLDLGTTFALDVATTSGDVKWAGTCAQDCVMAVQTVSGDVTIESGNKRDYRATTKSISGEISGARGHGKQGTMTVTTVSGDVSFEDAVSESESHLRDGRVDRHGSEMHLPVPDFR